VKGAGEKRQPGTALLPALLEIQAEFVRGGDARPLFGRLLLVLLEHTRSTYGFLGAVRHAPGVAPGFEALVSVPSPWGERLRVPPGARASGAEALEGLRGHIDTALTTGKPVSSPEGLPVSSELALPPGAPAPSSILLLPIELEGDVVGLAGITDSPVGHDATLIEELQPWLTVSASLLEGWQQRRKAEEELRHLRANTDRLSALVLAIPDLIFRMRGDGTFIDFNDGSPEPTALPPEAFLGKKIQDLPLPRFFVDLTLTHVRRVIRDGTLSVYEYELEKKGRGMQHYEARALRSGPDEAICIVRNVTERALVTERQAQLMRAEKLASLGQMAAGIAHEIKNPVSYVSSNLKTLEAYISGLTPLLQLQRDLLKLQDVERQPGELIALLRKHWERVEVEELLTELPLVIQDSLDGARRIKEIVESLRTFSREDDGKPQVVDLNVELESTLRMVWNELKYKCEVERDFEPLPPVICQPTQLAQVFTNLLVNAAQAIEKQGEIHIRTRRQGSEVVVEISDTGQGMTPETRARLFTPFFTTKPRGQGTGLGLSISADIITRHQGRIEVESEPGRGSTFKVYLPIPQEYRTPLPSGEGQGEGSTSPSPTP
jgi:signal transduction histidine kinase